MWSWVGLSRDPPNPGVHLTWLRSPVPQFVTVFDAFWAGALRRIRLSRPRPATPSRLGELPRPVQCLVDEGKHRGLECISILPVRLGKDFDGVIAFDDARATY